VWVWIRGCFVPLSSVKSYESTTGSLHQPQTESTLSLPILGKLPRICQLTSAVFFHRRDSAKAMHFHWAKYLAKYLVQIQPVSAARKHCHTEADHVMPSMASPRGWQYDKAAITVTLLTKTWFSQVPTHNCYLVVC